MFGARERHTWISCRSTPHHLFIRNIRHLCPSASQVQRISPHFYRLLTNLMLGLRMTGTLPLSLGQRISTMFNLGDAESQCDLIDILREPDRKIALNLLFCGNPTHFPRSSSEFPYFASSLVSLAPCFHLVIEDEVCDLRSN